jgi:hypothetical protein
MQLDFRPKDRPNRRVFHNFTKHPEADLLNKGSCFARTLGVAKFINTKYMILVTLCSRTKMFIKPTSLRQFNYQAFQAICLKVNAPPPPQSSLKTVIFIQNLNLAHLPKRKQLMNKI